jgi:7,8-dihydropterin-6-yl-methyl-4-(beta-D-ribofuranosyl)aminobenzene 5'-phosphate synthase
MSQKISISVLVENSVHERGLKAEHGLAWHIQFGSHQVLFDTGQSDLLVENARQLGICLDRLDAIVLSHGHYDHTGGLAAVAAASPCPPVFLHPAAREPKFSLQPDGTPRFIGVPEASRAVLARHQARIIETRTCTEVVKGLFVTGEIPRRTPYEDPGGRFFLDERATQPDPVRDDQAVFFDTSTGVVVLLGCAHAGVVNTLDYIQGLNPGRPFRAVLGGLHLLNASPERMKRTLAALEQRDIRQFVPAHCTGWPATLALWNRFGEHCSSGGVGSRYAFAG